MRDILSDLENFSPNEKDPIRRAQSTMKRQLPNRFYKTVSVAQTPAGYQIHLDGKVLKTPARDDLLLPSRALADAVAVEWDAQETKINPGAMPLTRICNTALDGVSKTMNEVRAEILAFAQSDFLCYRADTPERLVAIQAEHWDPYLNWMETKHGTRFALAQGVIHVAQPKEAVTAVERILNAVDSPLVLAALHVLTSLTGSVILPLALAEGQADGDSVWTATHVDEDWTTSQWGEDFEAAQRRLLRRKEFDAANTVLSTVTTA